MLQDSILLFLPLGGGSQESLNFVISPRGIKGRKRPAIPDEPLVDVFLLPADIDQNVADKTTERVKHFVRRVHGGGHRTGHLGLTGLFQEFMEFDGRGLAEKLPIILAELLELSKLSCRQLGFLLLTE